MGKGSMGEAGGATVTERRILKEALEAHRPELIQRLDASTLFLTYLAKHRLIEGNDILRYERHKSRQRRNEDVLEGVLRNEAEVQDGYNKFLDALKRSDQENLANMITSVEKELDIVDRYQTNLENHLEDVHKYLKKESRRTEVNFATETPLSRVKDESPKADNAPNRAEMTDFLQKVHHTTRATLVQFDRCKEVIEKLHRDCDTVALKNAELLSKMRDCDDMVKELVPKDVLKALPPVERDDTMTSARTGQSSTPRSNKRNEAEAITASIKRKLELIEEDRQAHQESDKTSELILEKILEDVGERRALLDRHTEKPPRDITGVNKYMVDLNKDQRGSTSPRRSTFTRIEPLRVKVEELAEVMETYVHQEKQLTHKANLSKYDSMSHRNFDQIDDDLVHLQRELRHDDKTRAMEVARHIVEATKGEREECLKMVDELEKTVRTRRLKLQENASRGTRVGMRRGVPQRRGRVARKTDSSFSKRLNGLSNEVKLYMDQEIDQNQRNNAEMLKKKQESDTQLKKQSQEIKKLEKKIKEMENEKSKFKRLYDQERIVRQSRILQKPTLAGRRSSSTRSIGPEPPRKSRPDRYNGQDRYQRKGVQKPNGKEESKEEDRKLPEAKPRLTSKARHLTTIKESPSTETKLPDINKKD